MAVVVAVVVFAEGRLVSHLATQQPAGQGHARQDGYLALLRTIGSARAAYTSVLFPLVALLISTFVEGYEWSAVAAAGVAVIIAGNWLALTRIERI